MRFILNWKTALSVLLVVSSNSIISVAADDDYTFNQLGQDIDGEAEHDYSGYSVALSHSGLTLAVGATGNDKNGAYSVGHARVYKFENSTWMQLGQDIDGEFQYDNSGYDVDISSNGLIVAVAAIYNDAGGSSSGQVRVFEYIGNMWQQMGDGLDGTSSYQYFGRSIALSGDGMTIAAAASYYAAVYQYNGTAWNPLGQQISKQYGYQPSKLSLSSDGSVLALGEYTYNRVLVYQYETGTGWIQMGQALTGTGGGFGHVVSLASDGNTLGVSEQYESNSMGSVSVFEYNGTAWNALGGKIYGNHEGEHFGHDIEISSAGDRIAIGAYQSCGWTGRVVLYAYNGNGSWLQRGEDLYGESFLDYSGRAVALSGDGDVLASGARNNDGINGTNSGHVRVYQSVAGTPPAVPPPVPSEDYAFDQLGQDIDGENAYDNSGTSLALSLDGKTIAIGATGNDNDGNYNSGHVRVYEFVDGSWIQMGKDIDGEHYGDYSGFDVDISSNGLVVAVGAHTNSDGAYYGGQVRVFQYDGNMWQQMRGDLDGHTQYSYLGRSIALSSDGTTLAASANYYAVVYNYNGTAWNILGEEISKQYSWSTSAISLSSDGSVLAIGEVYENEVHVLKYNGTAWTPMGPTITGPDYYFGMSVSLSSAGTTIGIGNYRETTGHGSVQVFQYSGNSWVSLGSPLYGSQISDNFGYELQLSSDGEKMVVGAYRHTFNCTTAIGKVGLYQYDHGNGDWFQVGDDIVGETIFDSSGNAVGLSADGQIVASGSRWNDGINGTDSGHVRVYKSRRLTPGASGDPHFKTWSGESYDFHGICDLVLLKNHDFDNGLGMDIHIRTKKMKQWSFISSVVLRIGEDILEVRGDPNGKTISHWINGIEGSEIELTNNGVLPHSVSGFPIFYTQTNSKQHEFIVDLGNNEQIVVKTWKELVRIDVRGATKTNFGKSLGLMGTFRKGLHMGRDGMTVLTDFNDFGQEWQVLPSEPVLFHNREGPQAPERCVVPTSTKLRRRLTENSISQERAIVACAGVDEADRDMCIFDVMATNDMEIIGAY